MADVEEQGADAGSVKLENGATADEQPTAEELPDSAAAPAEDAAPETEGAPGEADTENNNKRKLEDEVKDEEDGPAKKKPVIAAGEGEAAGEDDPAGNGVEESDPPAQTIAGGDPEPKVAANTAQQNGSDLKTGEKVIAVARNMVGKLIGREGATIRDLQIRSGAKIQIDHASEGPNKTVTLIGSDGEIGLAETLIKQTLEPDSPATADAQKTIECPPGIVGRIIGRGGETIKALQSASNAHIVVDQNFPEGQPRKIHISGKPEFVERAVKMINEVITGEPGSVQTIIQKYGETRVIECPKNVVGRIIGKGGETIKGLQKECHASIQIDQTGDPAKVSVMGKRQNVEQALQRLRSLINDEPYHGGGQQFPAGGGYSAGMRPPFGGPGFQPPYPVAPGGYGGFGGYPQGGAAAPYGYGAYGAYPQYGAPQYGGYGAYGSTGAPAAGASDPYSSSYTGQAGGYQAAAGGAYGAAAAAPGAAPLWKEERDTEGRPYYYNTKTGVSQWEKPAEMA